VQKGGKTSKALSPLFHDAPKLPEYRLRENVQKRELSVENTFARTCAREITRSNCGFPTGKEFLGKERSPCRRIEDFSTRDSGDCDLNETRERRVAERRVNGIRIARFVPIAADKSYDRAPRGRFAILQER